MENKMVIHAHEAKITWDLISALRDNQRTKQHYLRSIGEKSQAMTTLICHLESVTSIGYINSDLMPRYHEAIKKTLAHEQEKMDDAIVAISDVATKLQPICNSIHDIINATEGNASARLINLDNVLDLLAEMRLAKRGDSLNISTEEKMPHAYKYTQSYSIVTATKRKSDGAIVLKIKRTTDRMR
jgi:hypothetical protein